LYAPPAHVWESVTGKDFAGSSEAVLGDHLVADPMLANVEEPRHGMLPDELPGKHTRIRDAPPREPAAA